MADLKPWKSMADQLELLKERGLLVDNDAAASGYLARIGYYRLSGYWYPLRVIDKARSATQGYPVRSDYFSPDSHFEDVVKLYIFDKRLRLLVLDALERIEMAIRVDVAYLLGEKDPCAHEEPACLHGNFTKKQRRNGSNKGKTEHQLWLEKFEAMVHRARREPFVEHHRQRYEGRLPVWVAIEVWDFGLLSRLFSGMQYADKKRIAAKYGLDDGEAMAKWLRSLNFIRNVAAHHGRLWNINILEQSPLPAGWPLMNRARPFMYLAIIQKLMRVICPNSGWTRRVIELMNDFPTSRNGILKLEDLGLCRDWERWLLEARK